MAAYLVDASIAVAACLPTLAAIGFALRATTTNDQDDVTTALVLYTVGGAATTLLGLLQWGLLARGGTLGHRWAGYRFVHEASQGDPGWPRALVYQLALALTGLLTLGIGLVVALAAGARHGTGRLWFDRVAGLHAVVGSRRPNPLGPFVAAALALVLAGSAVVVPYATATETTSDSTSVAATPEDGSDGGNPEDVGDPSELDVSLPFSNVECTGEYVLLLESSGVPSQYRSVVERAADVPGAKYLRTDESCAGFFQEIDGNAIYAAYVGPFPTFGEACAARSSLDRGTTVGLWADRTTNRPLCLCLESVDALPYLTAGDADPSTDGRNRVAELQLLLARLNYDLDDPAGDFGPDTESAVRRYQENNDLFVDGEVGVETWSSMLAEETACGGA